MRFPDGTTQAMVQEIKTKKEIKPDNTIVDGSPDNIIVDGSPDNTIVDDPNLTNFP